MSFIFDIAYLDVLKPAFLFSCYLVCDIVTEIPILFGPSHLLLPPSIIFPWNSSSMADKLLCHSQIVENISFTFFP